jgi:small subunit ribosomal protein S20
VAHSSRTWTGARTPQALKRVRQAARRHEILQPRRSAAKTHVSKALSMAAEGDAALAQEQLLAAMSALDRAAKSGAIHRNAAARRKSRLALKVASVLGGEAAAASGKVQRQTGKSAAAKAAKARIAATKAVKAKGEQTAAGKARAALSRSSRTSTAATASAEPAAETATKATTSTRARTSTGRTAKAATAKPAAKTTTRKASTKS